MKKLLALLFLTTSFSAFAEPVYLFPTCNYYGTTGECTVWNMSGKNVNCNIQVSGYTQKGSMINSYDYRSLYNGMQAWIRVNTYDINDPIVSLRANAFCNTF